MGRAIGPGSLSTRSSPLFEILFRRRVPNQMARVVTTANSIQVLFHPKDNTKASLAVFIIFVGILLNYFTSRDNKESFTGQTMND